jgi:hypothetical protein
MEEYYKLIFGTFFKGLVILIIGIYALAIINRYIREQEYLHYKQAWQNLYNSQNEEGKQFLEKVMNVSEKKDISMEATTGTEASKDIQKNTINPAKK